MWLTITNDVKFYGKLLGSGHRSTRPKCGVAMLLAVVVAIATTFAVSHSLHRLLDEDTQVSHSFCLMCGFAKGQVSAADLGTLSVVTVLGLVGVAVRAQSPVFAVTDCRLSPSRAPPGRRQSF